MIQGGEMPLWNSYQMGGMPFLANCQSSILYPFTIFFAVSGFVHALKLFHLLHYALAGIGFYLLGRKFGFKSWIAFVGSVVFTYNGYMLTRLEFLSVLGCLIWFPWILIFCFKIRDSELPFSAAIAGLVLSLSLFAGFPQLLFLQICGALLFSFILLPLRKMALFWIGTFMVFLIASASQWIPTFELLMHSVRGGSGLSFSESVFYSLPVQGLLGLIYPYRILHHVHRFTGEKFFWMWSAWWGFTATFFSLFSIKFKGKRILIFACLLGLSGILWSMGNECVWYETLYKHIFVLRLFRYPPVALYWTVSSIAIIVLCGLAGIYSTFSSTKIRNGILIIGGCILIFELQQYSRNLLPTIQPDYYRVTFKAIRSILSDKASIAMLSPKIDQERKLPGITSLEAKLKFRAFLFDLTNLPYRIRTIIPSGEPLALRSFDDLHHKLMKAKSLEQAKPLLNFWNVTHFLTNDTLNDTWQLTSADADLKVYKNLQAKGQAFGIKEEDFDGLEPKNVVAPSYFNISNMKIVARFETPEKLLVVFNVPFYPGWKIYCSKCTTHSNDLLHSIQAQNYFHAVFLPPGTHRLFLIYDSIFWKISILITLAGLASLLGITFRRLKNLNHASFIN